MPRNSGRRSIASPTVFAVAALLTVITGSSTALAQLPGEPGTYTPFDQNLPTGVTSQWAMQRQKSRAPYFQPIKVILPTAGSVTVFSRAGVEPVKLPAPAGARVAMGATYRLCLSDMPEFPNEQLFPSIEVLDRLHPPAGKEEQFPIPIEFTAEEIEMAIEGKLVTKVIYLEQPQLALPESLRAENAIRTIEPSRNLMVEADKRGRPMVLVRLGSRAPDSLSDDRGFYGPGSPVRRSQNVSPSGAERKAAE